ncbi:MAG: hypothetical protein U0795_27115 [Pirellulales bacterium]
MASQRNLLCIELTSLRRSFMLCSVFIFSQVAVFSGILIGANAAKLPWIVAAANQDGVHYTTIAHQGYTYEKDRPSNVAFFPLYPMLCYAVARLFDLSEMASGLIVANTLFPFAVLLMFIYADLITYHESQLLSDPDGERCVRFAVMLFILLPTGIFFRLVYSESLFAVLFAAYLVSIRRNGSPWTVAILSAFASACRPVGVALAIGACMHAWRQFGLNLLKLAGVFAVSISGLLAFAIYQWYQFGDPAAFFRTQSLWRLRENHGVWDKVVSLLTLEPLWATYLPSSEYYWKNVDVTFPLFSAQWANPIVLVVTTALIVIGTVSRRLGSIESVVCISMITIAYWTRAYEMACNSQARFCLVVLPAYAVAGYHLSRFRPALVFVVLSILWFLLFVFSVRFAAGKPIF